MGEIGLDINDYLYRLSYCDLILIERGYERRFRHLWSSTRWSTYYTMASFVGGDKLAEKGIHSPADLLPLPWERKVLPMTKEEQDDLLALIDAENARLAKANAETGKSQK